MYYMCAQYFLHLYYPDQLCAAMIIRIINVKTAKLKA